MSYAQTIDDYSDDYLLEEIIRRIRTRYNHFCDYCARSSSAPPCKYPERHANEYPSDLYDKLASWLAQWEEETYTDPTLF